MAEAPNLLPYDGDVRLFLNFLPTHLADQYLDCLDKTILWQHDQLKIYGKTITTKRQVAWYGTRAWEYRYSNTTKIARLWAEPLTCINAEIAPYCGNTFNACLLNRYQDGTQQMSWHRDDERELATDSPIASVSLGAARRFSYRHTKSNERIDLLLPHASLLIMAGTTQRHWHHALPASAKVRNLRINLTYRKMLDPKTN